MRIRTVVPSQPVLLRVAVLVVLLALWQMAGNDDIRIAMPTFTRTLAALSDLLADGSLIAGIIATNEALAYGFVLAIAVSIPLGVLMGSFSTVERIALPYLVILLAVPMIALAPVVQVAFGLTLTSRVVIVFLFAFVYIAINAMTGVRMVESSLKEMATSFGASRWNLLLFVILPSAVPAIMAGIRLGLGRAIIGMVVAELTLVASGLGAMVIEYKVKFEPAYVLAIVLVLVVEGVLLMAVAARLEGWFSRWRAPVKS